MSREPEGYRQNLQDILDFFGGRRMLTVTDVKQYTGMRDHTAVKRRFPFVENYISAPTLALCLSGGRK